MAAWKAGTSTLVALSVLMPCLCGAQEVASLLVPVGRLIEKGARVALEIDGQPYAAGNVRDGSGGSWLAVPFDAIRGKTRVEVTVVKTSRTSSTPVAADDRGRWLEPEPLIDCDTPAITAQAEELTRNAAGNDGKARAILGFVCRRISFETYAGMHRSPASSTLSRGSGICVNHARLFVALCRAAGVPARTISGAMYDRGAMHHHEWAEFLDDAGTWHMLDPTISADPSFESLTYVDLIYDIEANPFYPFAKGWEREKVELADGSVSVFCPDWGLQRRTGQMAYDCSVDASAGAATIVMSFDLRRIVR